jgi:hypothetical protein
MHHLCCLVSSHFFFLPKTHIKYHKQLDKLIHGLKNHPKIQNQLETKNLIKNKYIFHGSFNVTKLSNMNSSHQKKQVNTSFNRFDGQNWC